MTSFETKLRKKGWSNTTYKEARNKINRFIYDEIREEREDKQESKQNERQWNVLEEGTLAINE